MDISEQGLALIRQFEGFSATPYTCPAGKLTIGYGHVIVPGETFPAEGIGEGQAEILMNQDVAWAARAVGRSVTAALAQGQFDALVSLTFNIGSEAFEKSTLLKLVNQTDFAAAAGQFSRWCYINGRQNPGLLRRRESEVAVFNGNKTFTEL